MYKTKNLGLNITEMPQDTNLGFNFDLDLGDNFKAIDNLALSHRNITNCLLEVPQDIKLELVDGVLTLKEGSKVYIPNGLDATGNKIFDEFITDTDFTFPFANANGTYFIYLNKNYLTRISENNYSGDTQPSTSTMYAVWYDTQNNLIKQTNDNGATWGSNNLWALPLCIVTVTEANVAFNSIDQVFNGFGYIGSTVFVLPGIKGLIAYGRNKSGSLNNVEFTTSRVEVNEQGYSDGVFENILTFDNYIIGNGGWAEYKEIENFLWDKSRNTSFLGIPFCKTTVLSGRITHFAPKQPFHAVDYNDYQTKITELEAKIQTLQTAIEALQG